MLQLRAMVRYGCAILGAGVCAAAVAGGAPPAVALDSLTVDVPPSQNRAAVWTNKQSAYFYTQTANNNHPEHAWFRGFNLAGRRVFNDLHLSVNGLALDPAQAQARVSPQALEWRYPQGLSVTLRLFDQRNLIEVELTGPVRTSELRLTGDQLQALPGTADLYRSVQGDGATATVDYVALAHRGRRHWIAVAPSPGVAVDLLRQAAVQAGHWQAQRQARLKALINGPHYLATSDATTTRALRWLTLSTDALLTEQRGSGIYAGLPWFNEYWGRDSFIALPGAALVTGQFETARAVLQSFAQFQDLDPGSAFYGRVPNIVKPGSLDYHTTDGTPRFVLALRDYVRYSGDRSLVADLYPHIQASIEGALSHWSDPAGYLVHADNETWMDARRESDLASYSPRANRANDIQALWVEQLLAGAELATLQGDKASARRWAALAQGVREHFAKDFVQGTSLRVADHIDAAGQPDDTLRPNVLFALNLLPEPVATQTLRQAWQCLVFPWGVATLDPQDPQFHRYHLSPNYHKDAAYHNGTVWPWLDGVAMQALIERGGIEQAWPLFDFNNHMALERGVVGGLAETMDAYPHPGEALPRLTGTFLQAWSNSEQLRVWQQDILGIQPQLGHNQMVWAPHLPKALQRIDFHTRIGTGQLQAHYQRHGQVWHATLVLQGQSAQWLLDVPPFAVLALDSKPGQRLQIRVGPDQLQARLWSAQGQLLSTQVAAPSAPRLSQQQHWASAWQGLGFATPDGVKCGLPPNPTQASTARR